MAENTRCIRAVREAFKRYVFEDEEEFSKAEAYLNTLPVHTGNRTWFRNYSEGKCVDEGERDKGHCGEVEARSRIRGEGTERHKESSTDTMTITDAAISVDCDEDMKVPEDELVENEAGPATAQYQDDRQRRRLKKGFDLLQEIATREWKVYLVVKKVASISSCLLFILCHCSCR